MNRPTEIIQYAFAFHGISLILSGGKKEKIMHAACIKKEIQNLYMWKFHFSFYYAPREYAKIEEIRVFDY